MGILQQQIMMSKAAANGRSVVGQAGEDWVTRNLATSQLRYSERNSDLVSGYWGGGESLGSGRPASMYPDNRAVFGPGDVIVNAAGKDDIRESRTAATLG